MTEYEELMRDYNLLYMENNKLKGVIRQQKIVIEQLRSNLAALGIEAVTEVEIEDYIKPQRGRPKEIDDDTRQRIKVLKQGGLSVREIAKKEGVSIGTVSTICNE